jgi:hypothetical protein
VETVFRSAGLKTYAFHIITPPRANAIIYYGLSAYGGKKFFYPYTERLLGFEKPQLGYPLFVCAEKSGIGE